MTNYRLNICELHDKPQVNFCFDCGSPLVMIEMSDGKVLACKSNTYHVKFFILPHSEATDPEEEGCCDIFKIVE